MCASAPLVTPYLPAALSVATLCTPPPHPLPPTPTPVLPHTHSALRQTSLSCVSSVHCHVQLPPAPPSLLLLSATSLARDLPVDGKISIESIVNFDASWRRFEEQFTLSQMHVPREVVWLNGAPGAGKVRCGQGGLQEDGSSV